MRLKHLQLQGYKTFATKTEFLFPPGITAIVGPNGSGKSNIADAIRWVLGEQSYSALRGKRTEDMIFSGSQSRARAGMAEVTLTLDNSEGLIPLDFSEVTIGRRAYRDGQNEYRINDSRVRLRDVIELLSHSGLSERTYTVIGQGLVDEVLSMRPQERRVLFESAAGIAHYRDKREDALRRLEETQHNLERVRDIIIEIEPRLKRLQRQAERAQEHETLSTDLEELLRTWYGYRWGQVSTALEQAHQITRQRAAQHEKRQQRLETLTEKVQRVRQAQGELRRQLGGWHRQSSTLHEQAQASQREVAVLTERRSQLEAQRQEHMSEIATLDARLQAQAERVAQAQAELDAANQALHAQQTAAQAAQAQLDARLAARAAANQALHAARERVATLRAQVAKSESRREALDERAATLTAQVQANQGELTRLEGELTQAQAQVTRLKGQLETLDQKQAQAQREHTELEKRRQALTQRSEAEKADVRRAREAEARVTARFELLTQLRRDFAIYDQATRTLLTADLPGVRGVLAQLIQVPPHAVAHLATAVEAALGAYASAIVVEDWRAAAGALRQLGSSNVTGRVILLALDMNAPSTTTAAHPSGSDATPLSAQVGCDDACRPLVDRLLGRAYLVPDLEAAHALLQTSEADLGVTPQGQVVRRDGVIAGGRAAERTSPLAQESEWARLNVQRIELGARRETLEAKQAQTQAQLAALQEQLIASSVALDALRAERVSVSAAHDQARQGVDRLQQEQKWRGTQMAQAQTDQAELQQQRTALEQKIAELAQAQAHAVAEIRALEKKLSTLPTRALNDVLTTAQMDLATARQTRQGQEHILQELQGSLKRLQEERHNRERRVTALNDKADGVTGRLTRLNQEGATLANQLETLTAQIEPAEARLAALEKEQNQLEKAERQERGKLYEFENHLTTARLDVQRREDELERLRGRIEEDLGLVELELAPSVSVQTPLPLRPLVSKLPSVRQLPEGLEDEIKRLRTRLRRMGAINPNAPEEYAETLERHDFLQNQSEDLVGAAGKLHQIITEMDGLIEHAFRQTFEAVAHEFKHAFTDLFGGGQARLELTDPDDLTQTGVDIVAQPPGKRLQPLASLSGGERSLTAVALIFSILKISPTPFCILDEVDAMLDEANVGRFRRMLEMLTEHSQVVIVTHNRGTMDAADTIYGISMGTDSVSQAYSMRLDGDKIKHE